MNSIFNYTKSQLEQYFIDNKNPKFRATQLYEAIYRNDITNFYDITNLKLEFREQLTKEFAIPSLKVAKIQKSIDETEKFLFELSDGILIETVLMRHNYGYSVCVTTQAGCNMGCSFCASGLIKKQRNLTTSEIVLQVYEVNKRLKEEGKRVSHVVIMGIGEPFDNYENVIDFITIINDPKGLEIGSRHITLSTCGIVPKIYEFADFPLQVNLAVSLHFANNEKRSEHMKINRKYPISELMNALDYYFSKTNRRITFEYILLRGINDTIEDAKQLVDLIKEKNCYVNLIPYNDTGLFKRSSEESMKNFFSYLKKKNINVTLRKEQGHDIDAACGQLTLKEIRCKG